MGCAWMTTLTRVLRRLASASDHDFETILPTKPFRKRSGFTIIVVVLNGRHLRPGTAHCLAIADDANYKPGRKHPYGSGEHQEKPQARRKHNDRQAREDEK
jgi:hypothetical protein